MKKSNEAIALLERPGRPRSSRAGRFESAPGFLRPWSGLDGSDPQSPSRKLELRPVRLPVTKGTTGDKSKGEGIKKKRKGRRSETAAKTRTEMKRPPEVRPLRPTGAYGRQLATDDLSADSQ